MNGLAEVDIVCPYCGETIVILIDCSLARQNYIEDCQVCCQPITLDIAAPPQGAPQVTARQDSD